MAFVAKSATNEAFILWTRHHDRTTLRGMEPGEAQNPLTQLRRGVIEYCVLALLTTDELYGFDLVKRLGESEGLVTSEGTIYPLLARLRRDELVTTTWRESDSGPPRRHTALPLQP